MHGKDSVMKTRTFLLVSLLIGLGMAKVQAANPTDKLYLEDTLDVPVMCDGQLFWISGYVYGQEVDIYDKDGGLKWGSNHLEGELTDEITGEVFQVHIQFRGSFVDGYVIEQYNCKGSMGTRLNERLIYDLLADWEFGVFEFTKTNCH